MRNALTAITGASGFVGRRVAERLAAQNQALRLVVRNPARAPRLAGVEVRQASGYGDGEAMRRALLGAETMFLVPGEEALDRVAQHVTAIDAAVAAGVRRIVYLSFVRAASDSVFTLARHHFATEEHLRKSGVAFTFVRMNLYLDFFPLLVYPNGAIQGPAGHGRVSAVARDDVASVAAAVLANASYDGQTLDVTGRERLTLADAASLMARASGKSIHFHDQSVDQAFATRQGHGAPDWQVTAWVSTYTSIAAGELDVTSDAVERITGRPPLTLAEFLRDHPGCLDHVAV